ncbi:peroxiredoxin family protein [Deferrisoma palaeochoriense]
MRGLRVLLWMLVALPLAAGLGCSGEKAPAKAEKGRPAPDFELVGLDGTTWRLSDLRGKVVFVNLWATWCPPCRQEIPSMVRFYRRYKDKGVEILAVSEDRDPAAVRAMVMRQAVVFPVLMDRDKLVYGLYRATGVPETHLIDKKGVIRHSVIGPFDWEAPEVDRAVDQLLQEPL